MGHHPEIQHLVAAVALCPPPSSVAVPAAGSGTVSVPGTLAPKAQSCTGVENPAQPQKTIKNREITLFTPHRAGMPACSRWLSGAIPPEPNAPNPPAPRPGCQLHQYTIGLSAPAKPMLLDETLKTIKNPRNNTFYTMKHRVTRTFPTASSRTITVPGIIRPKHPRQPAKKDENPRNNTFIIMKHACTPPKKTPAK